MEDTTISLDLAGKTDAEKLSMLRKVAENTGIKLEDQPLVTLSDAQLERIIAGDRKTVVEETTEHIERKYALGYGEAKAHTEHIVGNDARRLSNYRNDLEQVAKTFRAMAHQASGNAKPGELDTAREEEAKYLRSTNRMTRSTNDITVGTGSEGGYLSPEIWETMVYDNLARVSLLRRFAYWFPMKSSITRMPKITANVAGSTLTELATQNGTRPTFAQATWTLKKVSVITTPFSIELFETADPDLVQLLTYVTTIEMNRKLDEIAFNTSDSGWTDLLDNTTNRVYLGNSSTSGKTDYSTTTFDDMNNLLYKLSEQYVPDEDVQGSGIVGAGEAQYWVNQNLISSLLKLKGTTNQYIWGNIQDLQSGRKIFGKNVRRVLSLPSSTSAGQAFAAFGNLSYKWVGYRSGLLIDLLREGYVLDAAGANVSLAAASAYALRVNQLLDIQSIDENAFSRLWTAAS